MIAHKLAKYFPILEGEEFDLLVQDIKEHGQLEPIVLCDGEILDGMNRYNACLKLGIDSIVEEYKGDDPLSYVISLNIRRRHLDTSQRAMLATEMLPEFEVQAKERHAASHTKEGKRASKDARSAENKPEKAKTWKDKHKAADDAAKIFGISRPTVERAKRIKEQAPDRVDNIIKGKETVTTVDAEIRQTKEKERQENAPPKAEIEITAEQAKYVNTLERIINLLPQNPPTDWSEGAFQTAKKLAFIITKRLEVFQNGNTNTYISE